MGVDRGGSIRELKEMLEQHASCLTAAEGRVSVAAIAKTRGGSIALPAIPHGASLAQPLWLGMTRHCLPPTGGGADTADGFGGNPGVL